MAATNSINYQKITRVLVAFFFIFHHVFCKARCGELATPGFTRPEGDITLRYGESLDIICTIYENKLYTNSSLYFVLNNKRLSDDYITRLNATSIKLHIENHTKTSDHSYICMDNYKFICLNVVVVGTPPQNVSNFHCMSLNYENFTCIWKLPENYVKTDYSLSLTFAKTGRTAKFSNLCPELKTNGTYMSCFWNVSTEPQYRHSHVMFYFNLTMNNTFGRASQLFDINHYKNIIPNAPENLKALNETSDSITIQWDIPFPMATFSEGVHHRVMYQCEYDNKSTWHLAGLIALRKDDQSNKKRRMTFNIEGLKYGHALCDIRVSIRASVVDPLDESKWSQNASLTARTLSKLPDRPPVTVLGSFEATSSPNNTREVYVYWKQIREEEKNDDRFSYDVVIDGEENIKPVEITRAFAQFKGLAESRDYKFQIWSKNSLGRSKNYSDVFVPKSGSKGSPQVSEPLNFVKVAMTEDLYALSWDPPKTNNDNNIITNYTLFWCKHERDRPYPCNGDLNWVVVPSTVRAYNQSLSRNHTYQFAIAANTENASSGMKWAECTILPERNFGKLKNVNVIKFGATYIQVGWKVDCSDRIGAVTGFKIFYCPIVSPSEGTCKGPEQNITVTGDVNSINGTITNVKPYTTYRISVSADGVFSNSQLSDPLFTTTNEAAPNTPPTNIKITNVSNSSISLTWEPPELMNGILKYYNINYNGAVLSVNENEATITNLDSYVKYAIRLQACTVACSNFSEVLNITTKMWFPGNIEDPRGTYPNSTDLIIRWDPPEPPRGNISYYRLKLKWKLGGSNKTEILNVTTLNYTVHNYCDNSIKPDTIFYSVRAINQEANNTFVGPWSAEVASYCRASDYIFVIAVSSGSIFGAFAIFIMIKYLWCYFRSMRNVEVKLPQGLVGNPEPNIWPPVEEHRMEKIERHIPASADEERLLHRATENCHASVSASSGSSSGDVSLESGTNRSISESGTEPMDASLEDLRKTSLRQRNVTAARTGYVTMPPNEIPASWNVGTNQTVHPAGPGSYTMLGGIVDDHPLDSITRLPIETTGTICSHDLSDQNTDLSLADITTTDIRKTPNPGYIPYNTPPESTANSAVPGPGYVLAGLRDSTFAPTHLQCDPSVDKFKHWQGQSDTGGLMGYVSVGDAKAPISLQEHSRGYVSPRQFDGKSLKED